MPADTIVDTSVTATFMQEGLLNSNAYFDRNINGWQGFNGTPVWSQAQAHEGASSLFLTPTGGQPTAIAETTNADSPLVKPGFTYRFTVWVFSTLAWPTNEPVITWKDAANGALSNTIGTSIPMPGGTWVQLTLVATAPANAAKAQLRVRKSGTPPASQTFYIDEAFLVPDGTPDIVTARASISPQVFGTRWKIDRVSTSTTSSVDTELRIYKNDEQPNRLIDSTYSGNLDTSDTSYELATTERLLLVWTGGDPLSIATATVSGKQLGR